MKTITEEMLARYHDGELGDSEKRQLEELLATSSSDKGSLDKMERVGELVRLMSEENLSSVSFEGFDKRILNSLDEAPRPGLIERLGVWWSEFVQHRKVVWVPAASVAGAAAAVLLAIPLLTGAPPPVVNHNPVAGGDLWQASTSQPAAPGGSKVVIVNKGQATGMEYNVPNDRGEMIGVVWIND